MCKFILYSNLQRGAQEPFILGLEKSKIWILFVY